MSFSETDKKIFKEKLKRLKQKQENFPTYAKNKNQKDEENRNPYQYLYLGFEFALTILACVLGGYYLDKQLSSMPFFFLSGFCLGLTLGLYRLIVVTKEK